MSEEKTLPEVDLSVLDEIIDKYKGQRWSLIPLLQEVQEKIGYIPPEGIPQIADGLDVFPSQVQGVISFYTGLYTTPRGKNIVKVCRGTACHVRGGKTILKLVKQHLDLDEGETTSDMEYTLETVACIGVCAIAPNMVINSDNYGQLNPKKVTQIFSSRGKE
ncbi:MAG: NADH-quinone oxidoreductase subunit NuoE [Chloroflexi bacterium]|jgi:NADH:ubiquinone oxidoreductase subunit E|nr:NADH-quinone oxidoreductase subunit NuoE [Chloroflexota bacterium]